MAVEKKMTDLKKIKDLVSLMVENDLVEVEINDADTKIHLKRPGSIAPAHPGPVISQIPMTAAPAAAAPAAQLAEPTAAAPAADEGLVDIGSPMVGTFYSAPSPDSDAFVKAGDKVTPETVVCIIEAMKVMNEIRAETSGTIEKIVASNGQAVEYEQTLFKIRPD